MVEIDSNKMQPTSLSCFTSLSRLYMRHHRSTARLSSIFSNHLFKSDSHRRDGSLLWNAAEPAVRIAADLCASEAANLYCSKALGKDRIISHWKSQPNSMTGLYSHNRLFFDSHVSVLMYQGCVIKHELRHLCSQCNTSASVLLDRR